MTVLRHTTWRALAMAVFGTLVGVLTAVVVARLVAVHTRNEAARELRALSLDLARCDDSPSTWSARTDAGAHVFAYDGASLTSRNLAAPNYSGPGSVAVGSLEVVSKGLLARSLGRATLVLRVRAAGPCAVLQLGWPVGGAPGELLSIGLPAVALVLVAMGILGFFVVARPLLTSIGRVSASALEVGDPQRYRAPSRSESLELDVIIRALSTSHARIIAADARARDRMQALERHLGEVAHDFRTPLTALQLCVEEALDASSDEAVTAPLTTALQESVYLGSLSENLRLVARHRETGSYGADVGVFDLRELVERVASRMAILARRKRLRFSTELCDGTLPVRCMPLAIERGISNVVENAVVHARAGGLVALRLTALGEHFALEVENDGTPGAADGSVSSPRTGTGLGMRITREICTESGWNIDVSTLPAATNRVIIRGPLEHLEDRE